MYLFGYDSMLSAILFQICTIFFFSDKIISAMHILFQWCLLIFILFYLTVFSSIGTSISVRWENRGGEDFSQQKELVCVSWGRRQESYSVHVILAVYGD